MSEEEFTKAMKIIGCSDSEIDECIYFYYKHEVPLNILYSGFEFVHLKKLSEITT